MSTAVHVKLGLMLAACSDPPRAIRPTPAFIHRESGEVLFISEGDPVALQHFGDMPLGKLHAMLAASAEWLAVPKFDGRLTDLGAFVRAWCTENGFTLNEGASTTGRGIRCAWVREIVHGIVHSIL